MGKIAYKRSLQEYTSEMVIGNMLRIPRIDSPMHTANTTYKVIVAIWKMGVNKSTNNPRFVFIIFANILIGLIELKTLSMFPIILLSV